MPSSSRGPMRTQGLMSAARSGGPTEHLANGIQNSRQGCICDIAWGPWGADWPFSRPGRGPGSGRPPELQVGSLPVSPRFLEGQGPSLGQRTTEERGDFPVSLYQVFTTTRPRVSCSVCRANRAEPGTPALASPFSEDPLRPSTPPWSPTQARQPLPVVEAQSCS